VQGTIVTGTVQGEEREGKTHPRGNRKPGTMGNGDDDARGKGKEIQTVKTTYRKTGEADAQ